MTIKYEPHPVSPERKAELVAQGFTIVDARFDPEPKAEKPKIGKKPRKKKAAE